MGGQKRSKDWHHRVPDFKLVYCGTKREALKRETKLTQDVVAVSTTIKGDSVVGKELKRQRQNG
jgi:alpha-D-ribose 1-methylphosphonate 5-triphosphate synthase subunit PhnI